MSTIKTGTISGHPESNKLTVPSTLTVGNTIITNASAGSTTITGEGGSTTTNLQQGLCKAWVASSEPGTIADSFNISGQTDGGTGQYDNSYTNNMSSASYPPTGGSQYAENDGFNTPTSGGITQFLLSRTDSLSNQDGRVYCHVAGDLA